ncbi:UNVERIFIED_CONTAM: hypothetical protein GTU68_025494 [Idotea baltica]|nr:hypothetical protein [Idotea baltica]
MGAKVLLKQDEAEPVTTGGIIMPDTSLQRPPEGVIHRLGTGDKENPDWEWFEVEVGETVLTERFGGTELDDGWLILPESALLGVLTESEGGGRLLHPLGRMVMVAILPPEEKVGSIVLPEFSKEVQEFGVVKTVADRCQLIEEQDYVFITRNQGTHFRVGGVDHILIDERKIKAVVAKKKDGE